MVSAPKVVEDDRDAPSAGDSRPSWGWLLVGLVLGAGLTVLVLRADSPERVPPTATTVVADDPDAAIGGIADAIEGFPDDLVGVTRSDGQSLELLIWPLRGEPIERTIPVGVSRPPGPVEFDVSARRIATMLPVPDDDVSVLYAGIPENASIVATEATGFAWHDTIPYQLAYTTFVDGEMLLWVVRGGTSPELVTRATGIVGQIEAWGDWGFAVQDEEAGTVVLLTQAGEIKDVNPGRILDSDGSGWLAIDDQGLTLLSAGGGVRGLEREGLRGDLAAGRFSDDGQKLALLTNDQVLALALDDDSELIESGGPPGLPQVAWSSDDRFVLYPGARGIWVVDTVNGSVVEVQSGSTFTGLGVLRLDAS